MIDDRAAFIEAILDDPDNDGPRLRYADWLEDRVHGPRPIEPARAEFIRVQCASANEPEWTEEPVVKNPRYIALKARETELLEGAAIQGGTTNRVHWAQSFTQAIVWAKWQWQFTRGFISRITLPISDLHQLPTIMAREPVQEVRIEHVRVLIEKSECGQWQAFTSFTPNDLETIPIAASDRESFIANMVSWIKKRF